MNEGQSWDPLSLSIYVYFSSRRGLTRTWNCQCFPAVFCMDFESHFSLGKTMNLNVLCILINLWIFCRLSSPKSHGRGIVVQYIFDYRSILRPWTLSDIWCAHTSSSYKCYNTWAILPWLIWLSIDLFMVSILKRYTDESFSTPAPVRGILW